MSISLKPVVLVRLLGPLRGPLGYPRLDWLDMSAGVAPGIVSDFLCIREYMYCEDQPLRHAAGISSKPKCTCCVGSVGSVGRARLLSGMLAGDGPWLHLDLVVPAENMAPGSVVS
jgi:hypothetical protein